MQLAPLPSERLIERPPPESKAAARRFALIVFFCFLAHAISIFLFGRFGLESPTPEPEEIVVEIVAEPPPEPPAAAPPNKDQPAQQAALDEKEATDAPRDASKEKREKEVRVEAPPSEKPKPEPQTAAKSAEEPPQQPQDDHLEGDPLKAGDKPRPDPAEQTKAEKAAPEPVKPRPEDVLAAALKYSPVGGGNAETTYLTTVYGLVVPHMNLRKVAAGRRHHQGELVFAIDFGGALMGAKITKSSGLADVDAAAVAAVRAAAPFPLPPNGSGLNLVFRFKGE